MAADYTFDEAVVLVEGTSTPAVGAQGVLRPPLGGDPVPLYDMNASPIPHVLVGELGVHQAFRADIPQGLLDFGSKVLVKESQQQRDAGLTALQAVQSLQPRVQALEEGTTALMVYAGDLNAARPAIDGPVVWMWPESPANGDDTQDHWVPVAEVTP